MNELLNRKIESLVAENVSLKTENIVLKAVLKSAIKELDEMADEYDHIDALSQIIKSEFEAISNGLKKHLGGVA